MLDPCAPTQRYADGMRSMLPLAVPVAVVAFVAGLCASGTSHAQSNPFASTIYVPADGLVFRTFDGHVIAKLSHDAHGGALEVFDEHERPFATWRNDGKPGPLPIAAASAQTPPQPSPVQAAPSPDRHCDPPYRLDKDGTTHFLRECF
jgi:hypothetical protein